MSLPWHSLSQPCPALVTVSISFSLQQPLEIILYFTLFADEETDLWSDKWLSEGHTCSRQLYRCSLGACALFLTHCPEVSSWHLTGHICPLGQCVMSVLVMIVSPRIHLCCQSGSWHTHSSLPQSGSPPSPQGHLRSPFCISSPCCVFLHRT